MHSKTSGPSDAASSPCPTSGADTLPFQSSGWASVSPAALYGVLRVCVLMTRAWPYLGSLCFRAMGTCLLIRLRLCQATGLLTVLLRHAWPTRSQLVCRCVYQFFMPHHPSQTWPCRSWQCTPPCERRREESGSLRVQFCFPPISYFLHTHIKVSSGIFSPSWLLQLCITTP